MSEAGNSKPFVICLGSVVADHSFWVDSVPQPPSKNVARAYSLSAGGMAANAAIAVARLGGRVQFWGRIGADLNGRPLQQVLAGEGVDTHYMRASEGGRTPVSAVIIDKEGERTILGFRGEGLDNDPAWLPLDQLDQAQCLLTDPRWPDGAERALQAARARGIPSVIDGEKSDSAVLQRLIPQVDHAIFSETGLESFAPGLQSDAALRKALSVGCKVAAVTRGAAGVIWMDAEDQVPHHTQAFRVKATNTTGAGDVFHGAYALALAEGQHVAAAMRFASAAGALRARDGATPHRPMLDELLQVGLPGQARAETPPDLR